MSYFSKSKKLHSAKNAYFQQITKWPLFDNNFVWKEKHQDFKYAF